MTVRLRPHLRSTLAKLVRDYLCPDCTGRAELIGTVVRIHHDNTCPQLGAA